VIERSTLILAVNRRAAMIVGGGSSSRSTSYMRLHHSTTTLRRVFNRDTEPRAPLSVVVAVVVAVLDFSCHTNSQIKETSTGAFSL